MRCCRKLTELLLVTEGNIMANSLKERLNRALARVRFRLTGSEHGKERLPSGIEIDFEFLVSRIVTSLPG